MADNTVLNSAAGGDVVRSIDRTGVKTQVSQLDFGGSAGESLVTSSNPLPVEVAGVINVQTINDPVKFEPTNSAQRRIGFASAVSGGVDSNEVYVFNQGAGMTLNQSGGNLAITTGTTANSDTVLGFVVPPLKGAFTLRWSLTMSQRIANQTVTFDVCDDFGVDSCPMTVLSSTSVSFVVTSDRISSKCVGQSVYITGMTGISAPSQKGIISSATNISGFQWTVVMTVAGFPASGTGTAQLSGWNFYHVIYSGTTNTAATFDAANTGYATGETTIAITSTAIGSIMTLAVSDAEAVLMEAPTVPTVNVDQVRKAARSRNVPDLYKELQIRLRVTNGSVAPASSTTVTVNFVDLLPNNSLPVTVTNVSPMSANSALPVEVLNTVPVSGTVTANVSNGTVTNTPVTPTTTFINSAASTNATLIKNSAGSLWSIVASNVSASVRYLKLYNLTTAPTVGTSVPSLTIPIPAAGTVTFNGGSNGIRFGTGISLAITAAVGDTDATAIAAADLKLAVTFT